MSVRQWHPLALGLLVGFLSAGCTPFRSDYLPPKDRKPVDAAGFSGLGLSRELEDKILALDPDHVNAVEVREVLSQAPAPRIINLHGGRWPVYKEMVSFSKFLEGMGYPQSRLRHPRDGTYSYSGYMSSRKIAGASAWYYEQEGLRPMIIGHSLGGFQVVRVLHQFAGEVAEDIQVWNPVIAKTEDRHTIIDPWTGMPLPVVGLSVCFASSLGAGGLTWILPNTWSLAGKLRTIPDSTDAFTGYHMGLDFVGGDFGGFGPANNYHASGHAVIRNVQLPTGTWHATAPATEHLLASPEIVDWINHYTPTNRPTLDVEFKAKSKNILFAADAWHDIKKHWVLELQRAIRAERVQRETQNEP